MIDWEAGRCDFDTGLFRKMMEVAKRYAYDENRELPILASQEYASDLYNFWAPSILEKAGRVRSGALFDDGCYGEVYSAFEILSVNVNASVDQKQGAWEFIAYLLSEEGQQTIVKNDRMPVSKNMFQNMVEKSLDSLYEDTPIQVGTSHYIRGEYVTELREVWKSDITEEWVEAYTKLYEEAKPLPVRTKPLLEIICEEADGYFTGGKSMEQVIGLIENRVQLYLDEHSF
ncbi:MAG: hypothetical protein NC432_15650 [Roseburia sp.]|nr:hypothetical protein [Roseburia sp.]MCM1098885.1 hypothetical protein [Ruminococcus flavefaciens]